MDIELHLAFKLKDKPCQQLVERYQKRAGRYRAFNVIENSNPAKVASGDRIWRVLCAIKGMPLSTRALAETYQKQEASGMRTMRVMIGGPDGWPSETLAETTWSFGPLTLPHALAAAVAAEQLYRVLTIHAGHPYHEGHDG